MSQAMTQVWPNMILKRAMMATSEMRRKTSMVASRDGQQQIIKHIV